MNHILRDALLVGTGGFFGAIGRFYVTACMQGRSKGFPLGTLTVNVAGSLALGFLASLLAQRALGGAHWRLVLGVGFLGAFTTFSTFSYESVRLWADGRWGALAANVGLNVGACLAAAALGVFAARWVTT
ncbi:fluoride efflux transporter CrcB [Candidatus Poribacteria bacterium]|jgi:fluoride exporter|nr:fluoride efflux transporter CrcB [Candidatus Poribacteria bacterium]MBT5536147.1 fluoride efflux transporter CrcB [Candidatus Poribacteria bacterium]MBT5714348.1 fluoride efflux transporter CrcB [Candidatus Poribacteria bacterium]MBT7097708.1 fluoride efflux transporter CrcB [Candidatus Poribacteria bacterium]MBT7809394.1 fluoride efflux transporter CrcB [Candidatus Poribacteria bacterium]